MSRPSRPSLSPDVAHHLSAMDRDCSGCGLCRKTCAFLQRHGTPRDIASRVDPSVPASLTVAFQCSLCRLCTAVCPNGPDPAALFLAMRRQAVRLGAVDLGRYRRILGYEARGVSPRYSLRVLPQGCDTVFFPGCTLPGTRPGTFRRLVERLERTAPGLGVVLDCCAKPGHDLGCEGRFSTLFGELKTFLLERGVRRVLVACPNCHRVFAGSGAPLETLTVYEHLAATDADFGSGSRGNVGVHDPCGLRFGGDAQAAVRDLIGRTGLEISELKHHGERTLCCGEGGTVTCAAPELSRKWGERRQEEAGDRQILTYCAGCVGFLRSRVRVGHVLDYLFEPEKTLRGKERIARPPITYLNRLGLKAWLRRRYPDASISTRPKGLLRS